MAHRVVHRHPIYCDVLLRPKALQATVFEDKTLVPGDLVAYRPKGEDPGQRLAWGRTS